MFSVGQYIVIGLASSVYVTGSVLLLLGRFFLPGGPSPPVEAGREQTTGHGEVDGAYVFPGSESSGFDIAPTYTASPLARGQKKTSHPNFALDGQRAGHRAARGESGTAEQILLATPICLN